ncbi:hypothetical protein BC829DRAFT_453518 [Chytridium lagenaria]|nr:hypothetical protein BC829DRAFT_453518 [Chytridium lagenaria]
MPNNNIQTGRWFYTIIKVHFYSHHHVPPHAPQSLLDIICIHLPSHCIPKLKQSCNHLNQSLNTISTARQQLKNVACFKTIPWENLPVHYLIAFIIDNGLPPYFFDGIKAMSVKSPRPSDLDLPKTSGIWKPHPMNPTRFCPQHPRIPSIPTPQQPFQTPLYYACHFALQPLLFSLLQTATNHDIALSVCILAECGHAELLENVVKTFNPHLIDAYDGAAIRAAAKRGDVKVLEVLERRTVSTWRNHQALRKAAKNGYGEIVRRVLGGQVNPWAWSEAVRLAAGNGHVEVVRVLMEGVKGDVGEGVEEALWKASEKGYLPIVKMLMERCDVGAVNENALLGACLEGHVEVVKVLDRPMDTWTLGEAVGNAARSGNAELHACYGGHTDTVNVLLNTGRVKGVGADAIRYAVSKGHGETADVVVKFVRDAVVRTRKNLEAFWMMCRTGMLEAAENGYLEIFENVHAACVNMMDMFPDVGMDDRGIRVLRHIIEASRRGSAYILSVILKTIPVASLSPFFQISLRQAVEFGHAECVRHLLHFYDTHGIKDVMSFTAHTVFAVLSRSQNVDAVYLVAQRGWVSDEGVDFIVWRAAAMGNAEIVKVLIGMRRYEDGWMGVENLKGSVVKAVAVLCEAGWVGCVDEAVVSAAGKGHARVMKDADGKGEMDVHVGWYSYEALCGAAGGGHAGIVAAMVAKRGDVKFPANLDPSHVLRCAVRSGCPETVHLIISFLIHRVLPIYVSDSFNIASLFDDALHLAVGFGIAVDETGPVEWGARGGGGSASVLRLWRWCWRLGGV